MVKASAVVLAESSSRSSVVPPVARTYTSPSRLATLPELLRSTRLPPPAPASMVVLTVAADPSRTIVSSPFPEAILTVLSPTAAVERSAEIVSASAPVVTVTFVLLAKSTCSHARVVLRIRVVWTPETTEPGSISIDWAPLGAEKVKPVACTVSMIGLRLAKSTTFVIEVDPTVRLGKTMLPAPGLEAT